jgi:autotransporter-associated beta strand protein
MKTIDRLRLITGVMVLASVMAATRVAVAADRYLDVSASAGLQGSAAPKWTNTIWSVDIGGTNRTNIASNDNVFVQVETGKALGILSIPYVPAKTNYYVNDITVGNTNSVTIGAYDFVFNIAGNITVQEGSYLKWNGSGSFQFKPKTTTGLTIQGGSTNVYDAGASAKDYTMGSLVFGDGDNRLAFLADQNLTFSNISGGSSNVIDLGSNSAAGMVINTAGADVFDGAIMGAGTLEKKGGGTLALGGPNTFSGDTTLSAGTLVISNQLALQSSTLAGNTSGAKIEFGAGITEFTLGGLGLGGNIDVALTNQSGAAVRLKVGKNNASKTCNGALSESGGLTKIGSGTLTLATGPHTYTGDTVIEAGRLAFTSSLGNGTYNGSITNEGTLEWNSNANQTLNGIISGGGSLIKRFAAYTLTLNATNTYSGSTIVSNGTLKVTNTGSLPTNTALTVVGTNSIVNMNGKEQSCISVGGSGFVTNGTLTVTSALYPGGSNSVGTLTLGNLTLSTGSTVNWDYDAGIGDTNKVLGTASLPSSATVQVNASGTLPSRAVLFDCDSIEAPGGVGGWTVKGALPNSFVKVEGSQLLLITIKGTMISFH